MTSATRALSAVLLLLLATAACGRSPQDRPPLPGDVAAARVGEGTVWASDVKREATAQGLITEGEPLDPSSPLFLRTLNEVIDRRLLASEAERRRLHEGPAAQQRLQAARDQVLSDMLIEEVVARSVNEAAVTALYREQLRFSQRVEEFRARQIVTRTQEEATAVRRLLDAGGDFDQLAVERSNDAATRFNGGDLGYFTPDVMPPAYAQALQGAAVGSLIGPFQTTAGWVLLRLEDRRREQPLSLQEARPQIMRFLTFDEIRELIQTLRNREREEITVLVRAPQTAPREPASAAPAAPPQSAPPPAARAPAPATPAPEPRR